MYGRFIITHPKMGIYLGNSYNFGIWSNIWSLVDTIGQTSAFAFETKELVTERVNSLAEDEDNNIESYNFVSIKTNDSQFASIDELVNAGLYDMLGDMEANRTGFNPSNEPDGP